jgi:hypothetical protein
VSLGLAQPGGPGRPGGSGGTEEQNFPGTWPFSGRATGSHDGMSWTVILRASVNCVYSVNGSAPRYISGGNNHVKVVGFEPKSVPSALEFKIIKLEMKIGGNLITQWAPMLPAQHGDPNQYKAVRFTSAIFAHDTNIVVEVKARFLVRRTDVIGSQWSGELQVVATETVRAYNVGLNWQTSTDQEGVIMTAPRSYADQAQEAGAGQRTILGTMNHRVEMPSPMSATAAQILQIYIGRATLLVPNTHGDIEKSYLFDSYQNGALYATMTVKRDEAVANGFPKANMALLMASWTGRPLHDVLVGTPEFVNFGTGGILWSLAYADTASDEVSASPPHRPISELYIEATRQKAEGRFANEIPALSEVASGSTYTGVYAKNPESDVYWWIPRNLEFFGDGNQRLGHVYMDREQRMNFEIRNADTRLWYLVLDPNDLRGE